MASTLNTKINSYAIERGFEFSENYTLTPTRTGSNTNVPTFTLAGAAPVFESNVNPLMGSGSWRFTSSTSTATNTNFATTTTTEITPFTDENWTVGFWFKLNSLPGGTSTSANRLFSLTPFQDVGGFTADITGSGVGSGNASKLAIFIRSTTDIVGPILNTSSWNFFALRRVSATWSIYLNGSLVGTVTNSNTSNPNTIRFGASTGVTSGSWNLSNYFLAPANTIGETEINEIWLAGTTEPSVSATFNALPMTASALATDELLSTTTGINFQPVSMTASALVTDEVVSTTSSIDFEPTPATANIELTVATIVISNPDSTQVTTSVLVSAEMLTALAEGTISISFDAGVATASAELENHTTILGTGFAFEAETSIGHTAEMIYPERFGQDSTDYPAQPMTASAISGTHILNIPPNYRNLVKRNDPAFYIYRHTGARSPVNDGRPSINWSTVTEQGTGPTPAASPGTFATINDGLSWNIATSTFDANTQFRWKATSAFQAMQDIFYNTPVQGKPSVTVEMWKTANQNTSGISSQYFTMTGGRSINLFIGIDGGVVNNPGDPFPDRNIVETITVPTSVISAAEANTSTMHHYALRIEPSSIGFIITVFVNGIQIFTENYQATRISFNSVGNEDSLASALRLLWSGSIGSKLDEIAIYDTALTNTEIFEHFSFVDSIVPDRNKFPDPFEATAEFPDAVIDTVQNRNIPGDTLYSSAEIVTPNVVAEIPLNFNAEAISGTEANAIDPFFFGDPDFISTPAPAISYAEFFPDVLRIDENYALYILEEFEPHRYVRFDAPESDLDFGSDTIYGSATPFIYNGSITLPINGINNNSLLSDGIDYTTNGLIVKESEWDDDWGTDSNSYHTSFWIKRDNTDTPSTTGVRILMSVYGASNGAYGILYQYQDRLHFETFDGTNRNTSTTANIINVLDYNRHNIVIAFDHTGSNNNAKLYVDGALEMSLALGSSQLVLTNSTTALAPNTETNNFPRAAVGALIAPYANTSLPLVPTATKMLIDEFYWSKMAITAGQVQDLYEAMPFKVNLNFVADFFLLQNAELINPTVQTGTTSDAIALTATAEEIINPVIDTEIELVFNAQVFDASAEGIDPFSVIGDDVREIDFNVGESLMAYADMGEAIVAITIPFPTMYASARAVNSTPYFDPYHLLIAQQSRLPLSTSFAGRWGIGDID